MLSLTPFAVRSHLWSVVLFCVLPIGLLAADEPSQQCFSIEFFYDSGQNEAAELQAKLREFAAQRGGLILHFRDLNESPDVRTRLDEIAKHFRLADVKLPAVYGMKYVAADIQSPDQLETRLNEILRMTAYVRNGCPHCAATKAFLAKYGSRYPALEIVYKEVITSQAANQEMQGIVRRYGQRAASLPVIHYCNGLTIGFDRESTTGKQILQTLDYWSRSCASQKKSSAETVNAN
ncbi:glutaredoxin [Thalassoglobus sp. JC818]|uniref:glutaredoxin family protein n=1 Tax=Thalassoglobus sp. JC818 TaxID=3232136 RepID=UPI0034581B2E